MVNFKNELGCLSLKQVILAGNQHGQHIVFNFSCFINNVSIIIYNYKYIPPLQISSANLTFLFLSNYLLLIFSQTYPFTNVFRFCFFSLTAPIIAHCFSYVTVHSP